MNCALCCFVIRLEMLYFAEKYDGNMHPILSHMFMQLILRIVHTVQLLLCFLWLDTGWFCPYSSWLLYWYKSNHSIIHLEKCPSLHVWHLLNHAIAWVSVTQPWRLWITRNWQNNCNTTRHSQTEWVLWDIQHRVNSSLLYHQSH